MQSVSSGIWTRVAVSISYDDNDYTTGTSINHYTTGTSILILLLPPISEDEWNYHFKYFKKKNLRL